jgi:FHA domain
MPTCPSGHDSAGTDFCDTCGMRMDGAAPAAPAAAPVPSPAAATVPAPPEAAGEPCPQCGTQRTGPFCEVCGFSFASGTAPRPAPVPAPAPAAKPDVSAPSGAVAGAAPPPAAAAAGWSAVVTADRAYFDSVIAEGGPDAASIEFPGYCPERRFRLTGREMRIGRRSVSRGLEPEIDLTGPPTDPGVSHLHAVLIAEPDGTWAVLDPGSSNGTIVNGNEIVAGVRVPLHDGDRVCVGAWTVLTLQAPAAA